jgi:hypothetical protein
VSPRPQPCGPHDRNGQNKKLTHVVDVGRRKRPTITPDDPQAIGRSSKVESGLTASMRRGYDSSIH